ncbi:UNVERIFIED_CONTAM: hypothetical protein Sradi_2017400 [Sesamum radiatum]|uniref:Uncharacterized protein n=1 Tax=Sesamum radiatum TaxID=300843 RepID=A0AAW2TJD2_SESRA
MELRSMMPNTQGGGYGGGGWRRWLWWRRWLRRRRWLGGGVAMVAEVAWSRSGGYCRYGCCGRRYYGSGCRCCSYAGEKADAEAQATP